MCGKEPISCVSTLKKNIKIDWNRPQLPSTHFTFFTVRQTHSENRNLILEIKKTNYETLSNPQFGNQKDKIWEPKFISEIKNTNYGKQKVLYNITNSAKF